MVIIYSGAQRGVYALLTIASIFTSMFSAENNPAEFFRSFFETRIEIAVNEWIVTEI